MQGLLRRKAPTLPAFLQGPDWERASRGLLTLVINNQGDACRKQLDFGRPDDAVFLQYLNGIDRWVLDVADAPTLALHAKATARNPESTAPVTQAITTLVTLSRVTLEAIPVEARKNDLALRIGKNLLGNLKVERPGSTVTLDTTGFGTLADIATMIQAQADAIALTRPAPKDRAATTPATTENR